MTEASSTAGQNASKTSFDSFLPEQQLHDLKRDLEAFVTQQCLLPQRPIACVTSGGTVADLEWNSVRCLDNFSTGLRGAIAVEEFLKRGYAVVHLWRTGSASPYARTLSQYLGLEQANHALTVDSLGRLFDVEGPDQEDELVRTVLREERDPWLSRPPPRTGGSAAAHAADRSAAAHAGNGTFENGEDDPFEISLNRALLYSTPVHKALRARSAALREGRLLTIPFRSVEEYLAKLQLCAESLRDARSLALFYLAAAVSDFYIPVEERAEHKIQSASHADVLTLQLRPVPKVIGLLRTVWAPDAFCVSFKLETDKDILRTKSERAVEKYGCHMVVGNLLHTRHFKVWVLAPDEHSEKHPTTARDWLLTEITKPTITTAAAGVERNHDDSLEESLSDFIIQSHFEFISWHFHAESSSAASTAAKIAANQRVHKLLQERNAAEQRERFWKQARNIAFEVTGAVVAFTLTYAINTALQQRLAASAAADKRTRR